MNAVTVTVINNKFHIVEDYAKQVPKEGKLTIAIRDAGIGFTVENVKQKK